MKNNELLKKIDSTRELLLYRRRRPPIWYVSLALGFIVAWIFSAWTFEKEADIGPVISVVAGGVFALMFTMFLEALMSGRNHIRWKSELSKMPAKEKESIVRDLIEFTAPLSAEDFIDKRVLKELDQSAVDHFNDRIRDFKAYAECLARDILSEDTETLTSAMDGFLSGSSSFQIKLNSLESLAKDLEAMQLKSKDQKHSKEKLEQIVSPETLAKLRSQNSERTA